MKKIGKELWDIGVYLLIVLGITYLIITFVGQRTIVNGRSMESTLQDKDNLIVEKVSYRVGDPQRYDIIVFPFKYEEDTYYIKRIIGLPGEKVYIDEEGVIYINDNPLKDDCYGKEVIEESKRGRAAEPIILGDDEYFVLGDNRNHSADSRTMEVGNIKRDEIIGKAWARIWPLNSMEIIPHQ